MGHTVLQRHRFKRLSLRNNAAMLTVLSAMFFAGCDSPATGENDNANNETTAALNAKSNNDAHNLLFVGQDLDAIRDYMGANCCAAADGLTAYIGLYKVLSEELGYGGLGLSPNGEPIELETTWGAGPVSAHKTITEFRADHLAIGLFIANNEQPNGLNEIVNGDHDDKIRHLAKLFKFVPGTVYLRIGYEFDGVWNAGQENRETYKTAWRRIVSILREEGADNVVYVWQASASPIDDVIEKKREDISEWYPGDDYVDWMALSWFIDGDETISIDSEYTPATARALSDEVLDFARARNKPVMIAEAAPQAYDLASLTTSHHSPLWDGAPATQTQQLTSDEIWQSWFEPFFNYVNENDDVIDAIAYINCNWEAQPMWGPPYESGYWGDTRVTANSEIAHRWNKAVADWRGY